MAILDFTTYDDVRAALGVSSDELEDATLALSLYEFNLKDELSAAGEEVSLTADLIADFKAADAKLPADRTAAEQKFVEFVRLFSTYSVARQCTTSLPLFSPKEQSDGKATIVRFTANPYEHTIKMIKESYERYRTRLITIYSGLKSAATPATTVRNYFSVVSPSADPVTGS